MVWGTGVGGNGSAGDSSDEGWSAEPTDVGR